VSRLDIGRAGPRASSVRTFSRLAAPLAGSARFSIQVAVQ